MSRPPKSRKVSSPPKMKGYHPFGIPFCENDQVSLKYEEYESLKLINYNSCDQLDAAAKMEVSRPTFTRIYNSALKKLIAALVEGKTLVIEGGNYQFEKDWFRCKKCFRLVEGLENHTKCRDCKIFGTEELINLNQIENS
jgi:predicted DNA-binding protein (UPF0251 family)